MSKAAARKPRTAAPKAARSDRPVRSDVPRGKRGDRATGILEVARRLFVEKGWESTTMADIAAECGIAEGTVYLYFQSKRELINGVAVHWSEQLLETTAQQLAIVERTVDKVAVIIQNHLTFMLKFPDIYFLFFREIRTSADYATSTLHEVNRRYTDLLKNCLVDAVKLKPSAPLAVPLMRDMVYGGVEHVGWGYVVRGETQKVDIPQLARTLAVTYMKAFDLLDAGSELDARLARIEQALQIAANGHAARGVAPAGGGT